MDFPGHGNADGGFFGGAALPGQPGLHNPSFIMSGQLNNFTFSALLEMTAVAARPSDGLPGVGHAGIARPGAADLQLYPGAEVCYADKAAAQPITLLLSHEAFLGLWCGRYAAQDALIEFDLLLPYFLAEAGSPSGGQNTRFFMQAGPPAAAIHKDGKKLMGCLMEWTQLAEELLRDAREGQPVHPLYPGLRPQPITSFSGLPDHLIETAIRRGDEASPIEEMFIGRIQPILQTCNPFYVDQAAKQAGVSTCLARFFLRRMARRGALLTVEQIGR